MSAGTVISGGFPGRVAQEVQPNQKCGGCLHYDGQVGRTGACTIGLRPWLCGEGDAQDIGYAPLTRGAGSYLPDMGNHGVHAPEVAPQQTSDLHGVGSTRPVQVQQVSLGEEHVHLVKSLVERHATLQKAVCRACSMRGTYGIAPPNVGVQVCSCVPLEATTVAKAIISRMSNAQRSVLSSESADPVADVAQWVRDVAKAGFRKPPMPMLDVPTSGARGHKKKPPKTVPAYDGSRVPAHSSRVMPQLDVNTSKGSIADQLRVSDTGGHLRPTTKSLKWGPGWSAGGVHAHTHHGEYIVAPSGEGHHTAYYDQHGKTQYERDHLGHHSTPAAAMAAAEKHHAEVLNPPAPAKKVRNPKTPSVSKSLEFKPHPESPRNIVARAPHGEYEISPTSSKHHRIDYYVGSGDTPAHTERLPSRAAAIRYANEHHEKISRAKAR